MASSAPKTFPIAGPNTPRKALHADELRTRPISLSGTREGTGDGDAVGAGAIDPTATAKISAPGVTLVILQRVRTGFGDAGGLQIAAPSITALDARLPFASISARVHFNPSIRCRMGL